MKLDILVFSAHPDDVELACSGTVMKHLQLGFKVGIVDLTRGELGTRGNAEIRSEETLRASAIMGLKIRENLGFRDGFFEIDEEHLLKVVSVIRKYQPEIILANAKQDRHPDHRRAGDLVSRANFLSGLIKVETATFSKPWRAMALYRYIQDEFIQPDFVVDISEYHAKKLEAIKAFKSQFFDETSEEPQTPISRKDYFDFITARSRQFGRPIQAEFAEGFSVERYIGVDNLFNLR